MRGLFPVRHLMYCSSLFVRHSNSSIFCRSLSRVFKQVILISTYTWQIKLRDTNDVFNSSKSFHPSDLHLCVLPLERETAIILFVENKDIRYRKFRKQFEKLDEESKLGLINYLIFLYTEDYFMAKELQDKIDLQILNEVVNRTPVIWSLSPIKDTKMLGEKFNLINWPSIPNLLSEEYKLR